MLTALKSIGQSLFGHKQLSAKKIDKIVHIELDNIGLKQTQDLFDSKSIIANYLKRYNLKADFFTPQDESLKSFVGIKIQHLKPTKYDLNTKPEIYYIDPKSNAFLKRVYIAVDESVRKICQFPQKDKCKPVKTDNDFVSIISMPTLDRKYTEWLKNKQHRLAKFMYKNGKKIEIFDAHKILEKYNFLSGSTYAQYDNKIGIKMTDIATQKVETGLIDCVKHNDEFTQNLYKEIVKLSQVTN